MATVFVVVADVAPYEANEMTLAEDDYVLKELSTTAADPSLGRPVLPRAAVGDTNRLCAHRPDDIDELVTPGLVLLGETHHQFFDVGVDPRSPWILTVLGAVELLRHKPPVLT